MVVWLGRGSRQQRITFPAPDIARKEANIQIRKQFNKRFREALASARGFRRV